MILHLARIHTHKSHKVGDYVYYRRTEHTAVKQLKHEKPIFHIINKMTRPHGDEQFILLDALVLNTNQYNYWQKIVHDVYKKAHEKFEIDKHGAGKCEILNPCCFVSPFSFI